MAPGETYNLTMLEHQDFWQDELIRLKGVSNVSEQGFLSIHPIVQLIYYILIGVMLFQMNHPVFLLTTFLLLIWIVWQQDEGKSIKKRLSSILLLMGVMILLNPLFVSRGSHILFYLGNRQITLEALIYGISLALMIGGMMLLFISFQHVLHGQRFLYLFANLLPRTALLVMIALRFVPLLMNRLETIRAVQHVRGSNKSPIKTAMMQLQALITWSLEESIETADSMKARGYGNQKRTMYTPFYMEKRDWFVMIILLLLFILCFMGSILGYGNIYIYPRLGTLHFYPFDWCMYIIMIFLYLMPLLIERSTA